MFKVAVATLGCKVNQVESEQIKETFENMGYQLVEFSQQADVYIINTCTVTHVSDSKSRALIRRAHRRNPRALIAAVGCLAQVNGGQLAGIEGVSVVLGNPEKEQVARVVDRIMKQEKQGEDSATYITEYEKQEKAAQEPSPCLRPVFYSHHHERTRAFVKIEDGCDAACTYCIVPRARGPVRSKKPEDVVRETSRMLALGYREVVFTGIHTGAYGKELNGWDLVRLLETVFDQVQGEYRIRISSLEPLEVNDRLAELLKNRAGLCHHLHIPLQSGCDRILQRMNRSYRCDYYRQRLQELKTTVKDIALTTDIMVGFPGETEEDFEETRSFLQGLPLSGMHVFKYSPRPGTPAALYPAQVAEQDKQVRSHILLTLAREKEQSFMDSQVGGQLQVLVEKETAPGRYLGLSGNYLNLEFESDTDLRGRLVKLLVASAGQGRLS